MKLYRSIRQTLFAVVLLSVASAVQATPVNVNTANAKTIAKSLSGIGLTKAKAIVVYRKQHGPFRSADDLVKVKGIGKILLERNRNDIRVTAVSRKP